MLKFDPANFTSKEWDVIGAALVEFLNSDRWDEFCYKAAVDLFRAWGNAS